MARVGWCWWCAGPVGLLTARSSDPAALPGPAAVVRHRRDVLDPQDLQPGGGQRPDGRLPPRARTLHEHVDLGEAVLLGAPGGLLRRQLRGERRRLARTLEADVAGARPGERVPLQVR